jgi:hypothetical protein
MNTMPGCGPVMPVLSGKQQKNVQLACFERFRDLIENHQPQNINPLPFR